MCIEFVGALRVHLLFQYESEMQVAIDCLIISFGLQHLIGSMEPGTRTSSLAI